MVRHYYFVMAHHMHSAPLVSILAIAVFVVVHKSASHQGESQLAGGVFIFLCIIRRHFRWVRTDGGGDVFFTKYGGSSGGSQQSGGHLFMK